MKLPEGWPTEGMVNAGIVAYMNSHGRNAKEAMRLAIQDALAAAPTPPAQEAGLREVSGPKEVAELGAKAGDRTKLLLSPAQEDEPVAWVIEFMCDGIQMRNVALHNAVADYRDIDPNATSTPLYTADDKLRKASERLAPHIQEAFDRYSGDENMDNVKAFLEALEGK